MVTRKLIVAGTGSNVGKTTVANGLMKTYKDAGYTVQGFKCGPDYIDATYQTAITGRQARNLDSWMCQDTVVQEVFLRGCQGADIAIIEGVMGLFDGKDPLSDVGSTAEIAKLTDTPVLLVMDGSGMARSAAAMVKGYQTLSPDIRIGGVVVNRVGSEGHFQLIKKAVEAECQVPVVGYLKIDERMVFPERYLGLVPILEGEELSSSFHVLKNNIQAGFHLDDLYRVMGEETVMPSSDKLFGLAYENAKVRIVVAKDEAFHFYYKENLELLEHGGAELVYFSPLHDEKLPDNIQGLYLGGGFPEQYAKQLSANKNLRTSINNRIQEGLPTLAEGGGMMYLREAIESMEGELYAMVGVVPGSIKLKDRLQELGYVEVNGTPENFLLKSDQQARGHTFHYSTLVAANKGSTPAYLTSGIRGKRVDGIISGKICAGYTHLHFASSPDIVKSWINECVSFRKKDV